MHCVLPDPLASTRRASRGRGMLAVALAVVVVAAAASAQPTQAQAAALRSRIVALAASQIGYHDHGSYCSRYGPCELWCSLFSTWAWRRAGVPVPSLAFTGYLYDWAAGHTYVLKRRSRPRPGDAVLFGTGPSTVSSSRHVGIVEAVYPGYLITIEGDVSHGVLRFVVPIANPQRIGEPGPIYAYASPEPALVRPLSKTGGAVPAARPLPRAQLRAAIAAQDAGHRPTPTDRRLARTIRALRAFQHMPYRDATVSIERIDVDRLGRIDVRVTSHQPLAVAQQAWRAFLARYHDQGGAYVVHYDVPPAPAQSPPPAPEPAPSPEPSPQPPAPSSHPSAGRTASG